MGGKRSAVGKTSIVPSDGAALGRIVPDLARWPQSWRYEPSDVLVGERIVDVLKPFLIDLLNKELADKTLRRHRDNLWMLGGEIIRRRHLDTDLARMSLNDLLLELVDEEGGPLLSGRGSASEQMTFDATCRKLHRFLSQQ